MTYLYYLSRPIFTFFDLVGFSCTYDVTFIENYLLIRNHNKNICPSGSGQTVSSQLHFLVAQGLGIRPVGIEVVYLQISDQHNAALMYFVLQI